LVKQEKTTILGIRCCMPEGKKYEYVGRGRCENCKKDDTLIGEIEETEQQ